MSTIEIIKGTPVNNTRSETVVVKGTARTRGRKNTTKGPNTVVIRTSTRKKIPKKNKTPNKARASYVEPMHRNIGDARAHVKQLVTQLLGTFDAEGQIGEGIRVPRINSRPVAARRVQFGYKIPYTDFLNNKLQVRMCPDPYRLIQHTIDAGTDTYQPSSDNLSQDVQTVIPSGVQMCIARDVIVGTHVMRFDAVRIKNNVKYASVIDDGEILHDGAKALLFDNVELSNDPAFKWIGEYENDNRDCNAAKLRILALGPDGALGRDVLYSIESPAEPTPLGQLTQLNFSDPDWIAFANSVNADASVRGLVFAFELITDDGQPIGPDSVLTINWQPSKPIFTGSNRWKSITLWDLLGAAGESLKFEIDKAQKMATTHLDVRFTDFVAALNRNGTMSITQVPAGQAKYFPSDIDKAIETIDSLGLPEYSWKSHPEPEGFTWVTHFDDIREWDRRPARWLVEKATNLDDVEVPMMIFASDFGAGVSPTNHVIKLIGSINFEWETTSIAYDLKFPPSNFSRFNEAYFEAIKQLCPFTHNPTHLREIAKKVVKVMEHPLTKFVVKTVADVGLAAIMAAV